VGKVLIAKIVLSVVL